jgi:hypothetical protein
MSKDKIIQGPWGQAKVTGALNTPPIESNPKAVAAKQVLDSLADIPQAPPEPNVFTEIPANLDEDQKKAIGLILTGATFVFIAIRPTDNGADFLTALHGDPTDLRNAQSHLPDVIERLYGRKGI